jgi:hypothetical protein
MYGHHVVLQNIVLNVAYFSNVYHHHFRTLQKESFHAQKFAQPLRFDRNLKQRCALAWCGVLTGAMKSRQYTLLAATSHV